MAARKKTAKHKAKKRSSKIQGRKRASKVRARSKPAAPASPADLVLNVARQMASVVERGIERTLAKLPKRGATEAAKEKLKDAVAMLRRQADSIREQAHSLEAGGNEGPAGIWRPLAEKAERAAAELGRRLSR